MVEIKYYVFFLAMQPATFLKLTDTNKKYILCRKLEIQCKQIHQ